MAIVNVYENWSKRRFAWNAGTYTAQRGWTVLVDDVNTQPTVILQSADLPTVGSTYSLPGLGLTLLCTRIEKPEQQGPYLWEVVVDFSSYLPTVFIPDNPLEKPAQVESTTIGIEEEVDTDLEGNALVNAAGDPIRGLTMTRYQTAIRVTKNYPSFFHQFSKQFVGKINSSEWNGFAARTLLVDEISVRTQSWNGWQYAEVSMVFIEDPRTWDVWPLNLGVNALYLRSGVLKKERIKLEDGTFASEPVLLTQSGTPLLNPAAGQLGGSRLGPFILRPDTDFTPLNMHIA